MAHATCNNTIGIEVARFDGEGVVGPCKTILVVTSHAVGLSLAVG
jgi:hypothetical protein